MKRVSVYLVVILFLLINFSNSLISQTVTEIVASVNKPGAMVQPTMWGVFFEDINFAADGGIYAELVKNRSFEFSMPLMGWKPIREKGEGRLLPTFYSPSNPANPRYLEIVADAANGAFGITNEGSRGRWCTFETPSWTSGCFTAFPLPVGHLVL